ncbi:hypothetical protein LCGC14_1843840, partial [marine sediment metagenome]
IALGLIPRNPGIPFYARREAYIMAAQRGNLEIMEMLLGMQAYTTILPPHGPFPAPMLEPAIMAATREGHPAVVERLMEVGTSPTLLARNRLNVGHILSRHQERAEILGGEQERWHSSVVVEKLLRGFRPGDEEDIPILLRMSIEKREHAETMLYIDHAMKPENAEFLSIHNQGLLHEAHLVTVRRPLLAKDTLVAVSLLAATGKVDKQLEIKLADPESPFSGTIVEPFVREWLEFVRGRRTG